MQSRDYGTPPSQGVVGKVTSRLQTWPGHLLVLVLSLGLAFPAPIFATDPPEEHAQPGNGEIARPAGDAEGTEALPPELGELPALAAAGAPAPTPPDEFETRDQYLYFYDSTGTTVVRAVHLNGSEKDLPRLTINNFDVEVKVGYDPEAREIRFEKWTTRSGKAVRTHAHVLRNVDLTTNEGAAVLQDRNFVMFSRDTGVRGVFLPLVMQQHKQLLFHAAIPTIRLLPPASAVVPGAKITKIEYLTPEGKPGVVLRPDGSQYDFLPANALRTTVTMPDGRTLDQAVDYRQMMSIAAPAELAKLLVTLVAVAPSPENVGRMMAVITKLDGAVTAAREARERILGLQEGGGSDMQLFVLRQIADHTDVGKLAKFLDRGTNGQNQFDAYANVRWYEWAAKDWPEHHRVIADVRENQSASYPVLRAAGVPLPELKWEDILVANYRDPKAPAAALVSSAVAHEQKVAEVSQVSIGKVVKEVCTPGMMKLLAAAVAIDGIGVATGGESTKWLLNAVSWMFGWTHHVPGLSALAKEVANNDAAFRTSWAFTSILAWVGVLLLFRPAGYALAKVASDALGERNPDGTKRTPVNAFFTLGVRAYGWGNFPLIQWALWRGILGQKNLYRADEQGVPLTSSAAWTLPHYGGKERFEKYKKDDAERSARALLSAVVVSERMRAEGTPIDPANLLLMFEAQKQGHFDDLLADIEKGETPDAVWQEMVQQVYRQLWKLSDKGVGEITQDNIGEYVAALEKVARKIARRQAGGSTRVGRWFAKSWKSFRRWTSANLVPYVVFGFPQMRVFRQYHSASIDKRNEAQTEGQYKPDFNVSTQYYGPSDAKNFVASVHGDVPAMAQTMSVTAEQNGVYSVILSVDNVSANPIGDTLAEVAPPLADRIFGRDVLPEQGGSGREQSVRQAMVASFKELFNPNAKRGVLHIQLVRMTNTITGFQVRFLAGMIPKSIGFIAIALAAGAGIEALGNQVAESAMRQGTTLLNKASFLLMAWTMGYTLVWPPLQFINYVARDRAEAGLALMQQIDHLFDQALRLDRKEILTEAVTKLQAAYRADGMTIPEQFRIAPEAFSFELGRAFAEHSRKKGNVPVATVVSHPTIEGTNTFGAIVSTILAVTLNNAMFDLTKPIGPQFALAAASFAATWLSLYFVVQPATMAGVRALPSVGRWIKRKCSALFSGNGTGGGAGGSGGDFFMPHK